MHAQCCAVGESQKAPDRWCQVAGCVWKSVLDQRPCARCFCFGGNMEVITFFASHLESGEALQTLSWKKSCVSLLYIQYNY